MAKKRTFKKKPTAQLLNQQVVTQDTSYQFVGHFDREKRWLIAMAIGLIGVLMYLPSVDYDFVYDDDAVIANNKFVKKGTAGLKEIWTTSYFKGYKSGINAKAFRPVPMTTMALELELFDSRPASAKNLNDWKPNPKIYHITNLLYYFLVGMMVYLLLAKMLDRYSPYLPIIIALLFVLHPIHTEVVANIKSRDTMLGFLNAGIAVLCLLKSIDTKKYLWLIPSIFFFVLGLFSKEEVVTFLAIIPAVIYFFRKENFIKTLSLSSMYLVIVGFWAMIWMNVTGDTVTLKVIDNSLLSVTGAERISSNILSIGHYLGQTVFPYQLISDYSFSTIPTVGWDDFRVYFILLFHFALLFFFIRGVVKRKLYAFGIFFYAAAVSPFLSIVVLNVSVYNDRFLFTPVLGICMCVGWLLSLLIKKGTEVSLGQKIGIPMAITAILGVVSVWKISTTLPKWESRYLLFEADAKAAPNNARINKNYGGNLARLAIAEKDSQKKQAYIDEGIIVLGRALSIYDRMPTGHIHLGNLQLMNKDYNSAEQSFKSALAIDGTSHYAKVNLANVYFRTQRYQDGINLLEAADKANFMKQDYNLFSLLYERVGDNEKAAYYRKFAQ